MAGSTPGPDRFYDEQAQVTYRDERWRIAVYKQRAAAAGMPLNRYLAEVLAAAHELDAEQEASSSQPQLPYVDAAGA